MTRSQIRSRYFERSRSRPLGHLVDVMFDRYLDWREDTYSVAEAYRCWSQSPRGDQSERFAAYVAALDQEESTGATYADTVRDVERWLHLDRVGD